MHSGYKKIFYNVQRHRDPVCNDGVDGLRTQNGRHFLPDMHLELRYFGVVITHTSIPANESMKKPCMLYNLMSYIATFTTLDKEPSDQGKLSASLRSQ